MDRMSEAVEGAAVVLYGGAYHSVLILNGSLFRCLLCAQQPVFTWPGCGAWCSWMESATAVSKGYKESANCRLEAQYAVQQEKDMIPLILEQNYKANGCE